MVCTQRRHSRSILDCLHRPSPQMRFESRLQHKIHSNSNAFKKSRETLVESFEYGIVYPNLRGESDNPSRKNHPHYIRPGSNSDLPVISSPKNYNNDSLDRAATKGLSSGRVVSSRKQKFFVLSGQLAGSERVGDELSHRQHPEPQLGSGPATQV
uniref:Uncharacterized protein n=1 Tax=Timema monikensis TaxID=170555 RepID=A0A7R9E923_9NEOP|nr:unnamed protein product [Timema monikensis]